jgi:hypothetical protein
MNDNPEPAFIVPGEDVTDIDTVLGMTRGYWFVKCPACGEVHERIIHKHWDDMIHDIVESHQVICMETKTTFFIAQEPPYAVLRTVHFGLTRDSVMPASDEDYEPLF